MKLSHTLIALSAIALLGVLAGCGDDSSAAVPSKAGPSPSAAPSVQFLNADPSTASPYSDAVRVGSILYVSGNLGLDKDGKIVPGGIKAEAEQMMTNFKHVLETNGSSLDRVVNCEVMLATIKERDAFNEVYSKYWAPGKFPARHAFGVTGLYLDARVEMACQAVTT
jgi:2-iminobutanoate/2-iminopropanoate deaminase